MTKSMPASSPRIRSASGPLPHDRHQQAVVDLDRTPGARGVGLAGRRIGGHGTTRPQRDRAALGVQRARRPLREVGQGRRQVERGAQRLGRRQQDLGAVGPPQLLGVEPRVEDGRHRRHGHRLGVDEVATGEGPAAPPEERQRAERSGVAHQGHAEKRVDLLGLEPPAGLGQGGGRQLAQEEGARPVGDPPQHVPPGRMGQARDDLGPLEAEVAAQHELAVAAFEQPHAGRVGGEAGRGQLAQPAHEAPQVQRTAEHAGRLGQEGGTRRGGGGRRATGFGRLHRQAGPNPSAV